MSEHAERVVGLYQRHATAWAAARAEQSRPRSDGRPMEAAWLDRFLALLPSRAGVLDLGCGCGEPIGAYLANRGCDVTGVDTAPAMIGLCKARLPAQEWCVGDMRTLSLGRSFAGILAWDSFFHLCPDDQRRMFPVFRAHAGAGGALMFTSGPDHGIAMGTFEGEPLYHASLSAAEYRGLLASHGFEVAGHAVEDPTCGGHTIWLAVRR
ncbi:MAG: methyltransferase domain-containing protein [Rhodospirillales bacterium]|nr:methyltransferase domain-containing protein [Rhodospirillales bacterium]